MSQAGFVLFSSFLKHHATCRIPFHLLVISSQNNKHFHTFCISTQLLCIFDSHLAFHHIGDKPINFPSLLQSKNAAKHRPRT